MPSQARVANYTAFALCGGLFLTVSSALAQGGDGRLPPPPMPTAINGAPAPPSASYGSAPVAAPSATASANANAAASQTAILAAPTSQPAPTIDVQSLTVAPGPGEDKRRALLGRIMEAKNQGIGTTSYMMAFDALEQSAKSGESEASVLKRVDSLNSSLDDQFKRSANLKVQRPVASYGSSPSTGSIAGTGGPGIGGGGGSTDTAALIQKLQSKYGNQIPDGLKDKIPAGDPSSLLKNPQIQDILKGLK